jgi:hypothetical protein
MPQKILNVRPSSAPELLLSVARSRNHQVSVSYDERTNAVTLEVMAAGSAYRVGKYSFRPVPDCETETLLSFFPGGFERLECYRLIRIMQSDIDSAKGVL